jgi:hypothetical protein
MPRPDRPDDDDDRPKLQSLAQAARKTQLNQVRGTLIAIGVLTLIANLAQFFFIPGRVREVLAQGGGAVNLPGGVPAETIWYVIEYTMTAGGIVLGLMFLLFGALVHSYPVPITVASLVIYILCSVICIVLTLGAGSIMYVIIRIFFIIALARAVRTAFAYQRETRRERAARETLEDVDEYE